MRGRWTGLAALISAACTAVAQPQRPDVAGVERRIVEATNEFRRDQRVGLVKPDPALSKAARDFADYMARTDRYGHEADGREPADRATASGYDHCLIAENIAYQYSSRGFRTAELADAFVDGWKRSPEHRKNMLEPAATDGAAAVARSEKSGRYYAVQMFGRPKSERIEFRISNATPRAVRYQVATRDYSLRPREIRTHWLCGPEDLTLAGDKREKLRPAQGDRLVVTSDGDGVSIRRQP